MNRYLWIALAAAGGMLTGCSNPEQRAVAPSPPAPSSADAARITQFYTTKALVSRGDTALVCYGVENATAVWLEPPRQELSAALARCVEISPLVDTTYKLTAEGIDGKTVTAELKVSVGAVSRPVILRVIWVRRGKTAWIVAFSSLGTSFTATQSPTFGRAE